MTQELSLEPAGPSLDAFASGVKAVVDGAHRCMRSEDRWQTLCFLLGENNSLATIPVVNISDEDVTSTREIVETWAQVVAEESKGHGVQHMALVSEARRLDGQYPADTDIDEAIEEITEAIERGHGQRCVFLTVFDREVTKTWVCDIYDTRPRPTFGPWEQYADNAELGFITEILQQSMR